MESIRFADRFELRFRPASGYEIWIVEGGRRVGQAVAVAYEGMPGVLSLRPSGAHEPALRIRFPLGAWRVPGKAEIQDPAGAVEATVGRDGSSCRLVSGAGQELCLAELHGMRVSWRRLLPFHWLVPYPFSATIECDGRSIGSLRRRFRYGRLYVLDLSGDQDRALDRTVALALGIFLARVEYGSSMDIAYA